MRKYRTTALTGCAVSQGQSPDSSWDEEAESQRTRVYHRPRWGMSYPGGFGGGFGVVGGGIGGGIGGGMGGGP